MPKSHRAVASFDQHGKLTSCSQNFRRVVPHGTESLIGRAARGMLKSKEEEEQWVLVGQKRVLLQALHGERPGCLALIHDVERDRAQVRRSLSPRQIEIAEYAAAGATAPEIARLLKISVHTVRQHLKETYRRLRVGNRLELRLELERYGRRLSSVRPSALARGKR